MLAKNEEIARLRHSCVFHIGDLIGRIGTFLAEVAHDRIIMGYGTMTCLRPRT
jgi:hypothetical protein